MFFLETPTETAPGPEIGATIVPAIDCRLFLSSSLGGVESGRIRESNGNIRIQTSRNSPQTGRFGAEMERFGALAEGLIRGLSEARRSNMSFC